MFFLIGLGVVIGSVLGGYMPHGDIAVLNQPLEVLIIFGAATGAFIIANPGSVLKSTLKHLGRVLKGAPHSRASYMELLVMLYSIFRLAKSKGMLALEAHIETPEESALFSSYPQFMKNHAAVEFLTDYLRLMTMGTDNPHEMETLLDHDIEAIHAEAEHVHHAVTAMSDGLPAFGIVAAVLGVIVTMSSITEPPQVLGGLIGGALVGTFLGVLLAYGLVGPIGKSLEAYAEADIKYLHCIKAGLLAHMSGYPPAVSIEFARKILHHHERPSFAELEEAVQEAPQAT
ncbi:MAG: flagellar motor stator protein MotA [Proteobacteria bacterium]|nr:flagellar motor stator protein MotA [Pseudomonadota bacterium]